MGTIGTAGTAGGVVTCLGRAGEGDLGVAGRHAGVVVSCEQLRL